jgi:hypothetical protein
MGAGDAKAHGRNSKKVFAPLFQKRLLSYQT